MGQNVISKLCGPKRPFRRSRVSKKLQTWRKFSNTPEGGVSYYPFVLKIIKHNSQTLKFSFVFINTNTNVVFLETH